MLRIFKVLAPSLVGHLGSFPVSFDYQESLSMGLSGSIVNHVDSFAIPISLATSPVSFHILIIRFIRVFSLRPSLVFVR